MHPAIIFISVLQNMDSFKKLLSAFLNVLGKRNDFHLSYPFEKDNSYR